MISVNSTSGTANVIDCDNGHYIVVLNKFIGTITPSSDVSQIKLHLYNSSTVTNAIALKNHDNLDIITVEGKGSCTFDKLSATTVEILSTVICQSISGKVVRVANSSLTSKSSGELFIEASHHIWLTDSTVKCGNYRTCIYSPYVLIQNLTANLIATSKAIDSANAKSIEYCKNIVDSTTKFVSEAIVVDENNDPEEFTHRILSDGQIVDRRKLYTHEPMQLATPYDLFKDSTGYTNVNLHRRIDNDNNIRQAIAELADLPIDLVHDILSHVFTNKDLDNAIPIPTIKKICIWPDYPEAGDDVVGSIPKATIVKICYWPYEDRDLPDDEDGSITKQRVDEICAYLSPVAPDIDVRKLDISEITLARVEYAISEICDSYLYEISDEDLDKFSQAVFEAITQDTYSKASGLVDHYTEYAFNELEPRKYEVGIYSLNSYRTTEITIYKDGEVEDERP